MKISKFLASRYKWTDSTKRTAEKHLEYWQAMMNGQGIEGVTIPEFEAWRKESSDSMRHNSMWAIKGYLRWAKIEHPLLEHSVKRELPPPQPYTKPDDVLALIAACDLSTIKGLQDATIVLFLWETWARSDGFLAVTLNRLDLSAQEVTIANKGGGYYIAGFGLDSVDLLERWIEARSMIAKCDSLFINIRTGRALTYGGLRSILENLGEKTGIYTTPHQYRRGAAKFFADNGGSDSEGMSQGGWKSHKQYRRYTGSASIKGFKNKRWMKKKDK